MINEKEIFRCVMSEKANSSQELQGGFTNKNFLITANSGKYVLRIPGKNTNSYINRTDEIENMWRLAKIGLLPKMYYANSDTGIIVSQYIENNIPAAIKMLNNSAICCTIVKSLVKVHNSKIKLHNEIDILATKNMYIETLYNMNVVLPMKLDSYKSYLDKAVELLYTKYPKELVSCHGDPKLNNFLLQNNTVYLIDWEYSGMVDWYFDLVSLVMTNNLEPDLEQKILESYESCSGKVINDEKYTLYKIAVDYMYIYWHLIKLFDNEMIEYNDKSWHNRLNRAVCNMRRLGIIN